MHEDTRSSGYFSYVGMLSSLSYTFNSLAYCEIIKNMYDGPGMEVEEEKGDALECDETEVCATEMETRIPSFCY
jgi:hypothetical protein